VTHPVHKPVVMLVEDEPDVLHTTKLLFELEGWAVITAGHPAIALDLLAREPRPDVIVTDFMMPWMNGRAFIERLRSVAETRDIPVVLLSAVPQGRGPWDAFVQKPAEFTELLQAVQALRDGRRPR
jgi:CheY-like chemotaxis protein